MKSLGRTTILFMSLLVICMTGDSMVSYGKSKTYRATLRKCSKGKSQRCLFKLQNEGIPSLVYYSESKNLKLYRKRKAIARILKGSVKIGKKAGFFTAKVKWRASDKARRALIKKRISLAFRLPALDLSMVRAGGAKKSKPEGLEAWVGTSNYRFFVDYMGWAAGLVLLLYGIYRILRIERKNVQAKKEFRKTIEKQMHLPSTLHPIVNADLCGACGACVRACPEGEIIKLIDNKAVLVNPTKCVGHSLCEAVCPYDAIDLVFGTKDKPQQIPKISGNYETNVPGLYIAGELGGMGLISNAVRQGTLAAKDAISTVKKTPGKADYDLIIVGAGPAGLAAGCQASVDGIKYLILEQNSFGGTVNNFPRGKVVMNRPCEFAGYGKTRFSSHKVSKESLLETWNEIREQMNLNIKEKVRFDQLEKRGDVFVVQTSEGDMTAKKVMLCMGVGGSPRRLNLPNEDSGKVSYRLIDAADYQGKSIAVVGGGNSALEAAQYLSDRKYRNRVVLLVRKDMSKSNQDNQDLVQKQVDAGLLKVILKSTIKSIEESSVVIEMDGEQVEIANDHIFVFAGAVMPWGFLEGLGIEIEEKTGQSTKWGHTPTEAHISFLKSG